MIFLGAIPKARNLQSQVNLPTVTSQMTIDDLRMSFGDECLAEVKALLLANLVEYCAKESSFRFRPEGFAPLFKP